VRRRKNPVAPRFFQRPTVARRKTPWTARFLGRSRRKPLCRFDFRRGPTREAPRRVRRLRTPSKNPARRSRLRAGCPGLAVSARRRRDGPRRSSRRAPARDRPPRRGGAPTSAARSAPRRWRQSRPPRPSAPSSLLPRAATTRSPRAGEDATTRGQVGVGGLGTHWGGQGEGAHDSTGRIPQGQRAERTCGLTRLAL
jgi:hypothetical protein